MTYEFAGTTLGRWRGWPAVIYVRISQADVRALRLSRRKGLTAAEIDAELTAKVRAHLADCEDYAAEQEMTVQRTFMENGSASIFRGAKPLPERDALMAWLGGWDGPVVVLTTEVERLFRDMAEALAMVKEGGRLDQIATAPGLGLHIVDTGGQDHDLSDPGGRHAFQAKVNNAELESAKTSQRRRRQELRRARAGGYWGGHEPFGYAKVYENGIYTGRLEVIEAQARLIREAAAALLAGATLRQIALAWNAAGVTTTTGGPWKTSVLGLMLGNRLYAPHPDHPECGIRVHRPGGQYGPRQRRRRAAGTEYPGLWAPILDAETAAEVRGLLATPGRQFAGNDGRLKYPLSGLCECGRCGHPMRARGRGTLDPHMWCPPPPDGCAGVARNMPALEAWVREMVLWWTRPGGDYDRALAVAAERGGQDEARAELAAVTADLAGLAARRDRLARQVATAGDLGEFGGQVARQIAAEQVVLEGRRAAAERRLAAADPEPDDEEVDWDAWTPERRRAWLRRYVEKVVVHPAVHGRKRFDRDKIDVIPGAWADVIGQPTLPA